ncbi:hypothetical protein D3C87_2048320 [compost metagenome]
MKENIVNEIYNSGMNDELIDYMAEIIEALAAEGKGAMTESNMKKLAAEMYRRAKIEHD